MSGLVLGILISSLKPESEVSAPLLTTLPICLFNSALWSAAFTIHSCTYVKSYSSSGIQSVISQNRPWISLPAWWQALALVSGTRAMSSSGGQILRMNAICHAPISDKLGT